ncbi:MAG: hydrogenase expression/formation protein HypE [Candidatus Korarchaeota archaeon]|nr:hydrogenase expression/formation protein HypE [Thermoproteota archaeon]MCR8500810.1 hydrogenase expression/formation protein HypE [Thermoproteota archaeon]
MNDRRITLAHGTGGKEMQDLIKYMFSSVITPKNVIGLEAMDDAAVILNSGNNEHIVIATDSATVDPIFFPGGNIGTLAAFGSINDVAVIGADPLFALDAIVVEEGFTLSDLEKIITSMLDAFNKNNVTVIAGDFKVMPEGQVDRIIITTTVIGFLNGDPILDSKARPGDKVIVSGPIGDHGAVITAYRYGLDPEKEGLSSDCASVLPIMRIARAIGGIHAAKDPTRGGLAMALNEIAEKSGVSIWIREDEIPIRESVRVISELLGIDPLYLACEGRVVLVVDPERAESILDALHSAGYIDARIIGEVRKERPGYVVMETEVGGYRIVEELRGELTPRIC